MFDDLYEYTNARSSIFRSNQHSFTSDTGQFGSYSEHEHIDEHWIWHYVYRSDVLFYWHHVGFHIKYVFGAKYCDADDKYCDADDDNIGIHDNS